jgi:hypothetical protein
MTQMINSLELKVEIFWNQWTAFEILVFFAFIKIVFLKQFWKTLLKSKYNKFLVIIEILPKKDIELEEWQQFLKVN